MPFTKMQQFVDAETTSQGYEERLDILKEIKRDVEAMIKATQEMAVEDGEAYFKEIEYKEYMVKAHTKKRFTWIK